MLAADGAISHGLDLPHPRGAMRSGLRRAAEADARLHPATPTAIFLVAVVSSFVLLALAAREIPIGTAYAVWSAIGIAGAATAGILFYHEPATAIRLFFLVTLVGSIIGLKLATPT